MQLDAIASITKLVIEQIGGSVGSVVEDPLRVSGISRVLVGSYLGNG